MTYVIAIDGPSGSGKSSTARGVAQRLSMAYLDTGAMYRAMTWALHARDVDVHDAADVAGSSDRVALSPGIDPVDPRITADGVDVTDAIRDESVTSAVSAVSAVPAVRDRLVDIQRRIIAESDGMVVEGRDIGTAVAPHAQVKIYLVADDATRAARRSAETGTSDRASTGDQLAARDHLDSTRASSPLEMPPDAALIDSTELGLDEVIGRIVEMVREPA